MPDFEEPKAFAFGDLNPVAARRTAPKLNPKNMSVMDAIREVILGYYTSDSMAGTGPYKGIVLRVEEDMDQNNPEPGNWLSTVFGPQGMFDSLTAPKKLKRYKVRIPEIHVTLPIPAKFAASPQEEGGHQPIIDMYPTFTAKDSNCEQAAAGDLVWVDYGHKGNFEDPTFIGPIFPPPEGGAGGDTGGGAQDAFGPCGSGGAGIGSGSGGVLGSDGRSAISTNAATKWANGMYLHYNDSKARNKKDPAKPIKKASGYGTSTVKKYVEAGGSGKSISGKMGLGNCSSIQNKLAAWLTATRIACEDQSDRGYSFGGKPVDCKIGGIDCSGFTCVVRSMVEFMVGTDENHYGLAATSKGKNWRYWGLLTRPWYGSLKKYKVVGRYRPDGGNNYDWVEVATVQAAGKNSGDKMDPSNFIDFTNRVNSGEFSNGKGYNSPNSYAGGSDIHVPWFKAINNPNGNVQDEGQGIYVMPGDDIIIRGKKPPTWAKSHIKVSHILTTFTDPEGNLRIAESGGKHGGTGSRDFGEWAAKLHSFGFTIYVWQKPEWSKLWAELGGRPNRPWTPALCRELAGDEYFSAVEIGKQATGEKVPNEQQVAGGTPSENPPTSTETPSASTSTTTDSTSSSDTAAAASSEGSGPVIKYAHDERCKDEYDTYIDAIGGEITSSNITFQQAWECTACAAERAELAAVSQAQKGDPTSPDIAATSAGARRISQVESIRQRYEKCLESYSSTVTPEGTVQLPSSELSSSTSSSAAQGATAAGSSSTSAAKAAAAATSASTSTTATASPSSSGLPTGATAPSSSSSAAASQSSPAGASAGAGAACVGGGSGGGASYTPGASFSVGADRAGAPLGDVPFVGHLGEITTDPKMKLVKVDVDKTRSPTGGGHPYYATKARVRQDVAHNMTEMRRILNELGCVMTSSGATRNLNAKVSPGRSATSFHYTSLAFDFTLPAMMSNPNVDEHVIEFDPDDNKQFIFWCRSEKTSGSVEKGGVTFEIEHKTLNGIVAKKKSPPGTVPVKGYWVNVTKLMRAHGMERISGRSSWYKNSTGASEAWHFDLRKNAGLVVGKTTFGQVLETVYTAQKISGTPPAASANKTFRGGSFSDIRLKKNINSCGSSPSGIPLYTFAYKDDKSRNVYRGVMAQDILKTHPEAVILDPSGYYKVIYELIDVNLEKV